MNFDWNLDKYGGTEYMARTYREKIDPFVRNLKKYDLIVMPGLLPVDFANSPKPAVLWLHNLPNQYNDGTLKELAQAEVNKKIVKVVVPSNFAKNHWSAFGFAKEKITVIHNAINISAPPVHNCSNKVPSFMYISHPSRGLELLLRAIDLFDFNFELEVFGKFRPEETNFLLDDKPVRWIKKLKNINKVRFYGESPDATIFTHLRKADLLLYPTTFLETFCLSAIETVALGTRLVTAPYGALPEIVGERARYVPFDERLSKTIDSGLGHYFQDYLDKYPTTSQDNLSAFASAVQEELEDPIPIEQKIIWAKDVQEKYSWEKIKKDWLLLDESLA